MRYSLSNYVVSFASENTNINRLFGNIQIGGEGDALSNISVQTTDTLWSTTSFATGAWVHNKNLSRVGEISVSISQLTDAVAKFKTFINYFYNETENNTINGLTITIMDANRNQTVATCEDCYPTKIPTQSFAATAAEQTWTFTCGQITFN